MNIDFYKTLFNSFDNSSNEHQVNLIKINNEYYLYFKKNKKFGLILWFMVIVVSGSVFLWIMSTVDEDDDNKWVDVFDWIGVIFNVCNYFFIFIVICI